MPFTVQGITEQDQAEKEKRATSKSKMDFWGGGGVVFGFLVVVCVLLLLSESRDFLGEMK